MKLTDKTQDNQVAEKLGALLTKQVTPLDLLPHLDLREKLIELMVNGIPRGQSGETTQLFRDLMKSIAAQNTEEVRVVVFGGGTGLSNIIGGDSRSDLWKKRPFAGLKEIFPKTRSVVCVTDDGGSTGELLKDIPLIAIGDIRHVLLSSIQLQHLQFRYQLTVAQAHQVASALADVFNCRFESRPADAEALLSATGIQLDALPEELRLSIEKYVKYLFSCEHLNHLLQRPHCLGNLILVSAIYTHLGADMTVADLLLNPELMDLAIMSGLEQLATEIGADASAVMPCTATPAQLRIRYSNGIEITGESRSSSARRGFPVDRVLVDFCAQPSVYPSILEAIAKADILLLAPGSLYSSIIPVFKVPGLAEAVRNNAKALKILVSNLWVQTGETDLSFTDPDRKFYVSDMIKAYERNIPGGTYGLFDEVLCLSLKDVPASVIQNYAVEGKIPIYLDREQVSEMGYVPVECGIFSRVALAERAVIQHDPVTLALAVKTLYAGRTLFEQCGRLPGGGFGQPLENEPIVCTLMLPCLKYANILEKIQGYALYGFAESDGSLNTSRIKNLLSEIIWKNSNIPLSHLDFATGVSCVAISDWPRDQQWDNVFSFYDPLDRCIKIRQDQFADPNKLEAAFLIALGESLLGNYAERKVVKRLERQGLHLGKVYHLFLTDLAQRKCFFNPEQLDEYLQLARMCRATGSGHYTRLINGEEGFTPPGLLMGLVYAWYLENRQASHIEYKMIAMKIPQTDLIPEQKRMIARRSRLISFFRDVVFK